MTTSMGPSIRARKVMSGKLRRYAHFKFVDYLQHFDVVLKNVLDGFKISIGFIQSIIGLLRFKPDVVFLKGGYVGLPVGMAARFLRIPYVIHDSDAVPGLTNRLLAGGAKMIATGMPLDNYKYPEEKAEWTGIPVGEEFRPVSAKRRDELKRELGFERDEPLTVITGGSLGARNINKAVQEVLPELLKCTSVLLVAGRERYPEMMELKNHEVWEDGKLKTNFRMFEFTVNMSELFGAADVVVSRAGATTMAELANMHKAVVMVPNQKLPGRHQVKNAEAFAKAKAAIVVEDGDMVEQPGLLLKAVRGLAKDRQKREELARNLKEFAMEDAAGRLATMIVNTGSKNGKKL
jgi:UDP-N-acetylglucosamine--N-acetylmuramyl-(pentapeptide) pyrophosphoryl-undecaprenol N-acetylglucosamine transferase